MIRQIYIAVLALVWTLLLNSCLTENGGGGTDTEGLHGYVYESDGKASVNAHVYLYEYSSLQTASDLSPIDSSFTDQSGFYQFTSLAKGTYNIIAANQASDKGFINEILYESISYKADDLVLEPPGKLLGVINIANTDKSHGMCFLLGTSFISTTDSNGSFVISGIPEGRYTLRITYPKYIDTTIDGILIQSSKQSLIAPIVLKFDPSQQPTAPTNFKANVDTLNGIVHLEWNASSELDLAGYIIYRNINAVSVPIPINPDKYVTDTFFDDLIDTLPDNRAEKIYYYRIVTVDKNGNLSVFGPAPLKVLAPILNKPRNVFPLDGDKGVDADVILNWSYLVNPMTTEGVHYTVLLDKYNPPKQIISQNKQANFFATTSLDPWTTYKWQVLAIIGNDTVASNIWTFTTQPDKTPPVISIYDKFNLYILRDTKWIDPGYFCEDNVDGRVNALLSNDINTHVIGTYHVHYTCTDGSGNVAVPVIRTVSVVDSLPPPIISKLNHVLVFNNPGITKHESIPSIANMIRDMGMLYDFEVSYSGKPAIFSAESLARYDVIFLNNVVSIEKILNEEQRTAFEYWYRNGKGVVAIHGSSYVDSETAWPWFYQMIGASMTSSIKNVQARISINAKTKTLDEFQGFPDTILVKDEWLNFDQNPLYQEGTVVLMSLIESGFDGGTMGADHPYTWIRNFEGGRAFYTGLGHEKSLAENESFYKIILGGLKWAAGYD